MKKISKGNKIVRF